MKTHKESFTVLALASLESTLLSFLLVIVFLFEEFYVVLKADQGILFVHV